VLLPDVPDGRDALNLTPGTADILKGRGYIVGQLLRVIFFEPGIKENDWSVTGPAEGVDGKIGRWVYLHYFKERQPSLNWLEPSFATQQMVVGDALHSMDGLGAVGLRLDANGFLGVEVRADGHAWSEGHPLSIVSNQSLAGIIRKAGGFSFQELNLTVDDIAMMSKGGADLSYDFITRPAYQHALLTGDTEFLRLMLRMVHEYKIDPASLIYTLQNHDELTLELVHFRTLHADDIYTFKGQTWQGRVLWKHIRETMYSRLSGENAPYNLPFATNGIACTTVSIITVALGIRDLEMITDEQKILIQRAHILLVMYNAFQPGVFALSGWDLVGALPIASSTVSDLMMDGDTRWIARGAYDLMDKNPHILLSSDGLPKARMLYGSLKKQLKTPGSFAMQLKHLLAIRRAYGMAASRQGAILDVISAGLLVMIHKLPDARGTQVTALNFSGAQATETLVLPNVAPGPIVDMIRETVFGDFPESGELPIDLEPYEGLSLRIVSSTRTIVN
jgi:trehalose synthase